MNAVSHRDRRQMPRPLHTIVERTDVLFGFNSSYQAGWFSQRQGKSVVAEHDVLEGSLFGLGDFLDYAEDVL